MGGGVGEGDGDGAGVGDGVGVGWVCEKAAGRKQKAESRSKVISKRWDVSRKEKASRRDAMRIAQRFIAGIGREEFF